MIERRYAKERPFNPQGPLREITPILDGQFPEWCQPKDDEDRAALFNVYQWVCSLPPDLVTVSQFAADHKAVMSPLELWAYIANLIYADLVSLRCVTCEAYLKREEGRWVCPDRRPYEDNEDHPVFDANGSIVQKAESVAQALGGRVRNNLPIDRITVAIPREVQILAARLARAVDLSPERVKTIVSRIYGEIALFRIGYAEPLWINAFDPKAMHETASCKVQQRWFCTTLDLAIRTQAWHLLKAMCVAGKELDAKTSGMPAVAIDWLLGLTDSPDGYIQAQTCLAAAAGDQEMVRHIRHNLTAKKAPKDESGITRGRTDRALAKDDERGYYHLALHDMAWRRSNPDPNALLRKSVRSHAHEEYRLDTGSTGRAGETSREHPDSPLTELKSKTHSTMDLESLDGSSMLLEQIGFDVSKGSFRWMELRQDALKAARKVGLAETHAQLFLAELDYPGDPDTQMNQVYGRIIAETSLKAAKAKIYRAKPRIAELLRRWHADWKRGPETAALHQWRQEHPTAPKDLHA